MGPNKAVHLVFLSGGLLLFFLVQWTGDWIWGYFVKEPNEFILNGIAVIVALGVGIGLYRNERVYTLTDEVMSELKKVTWPTMQETRAATLVVIVTVIVAAIILGIFDAVWSKVTDLIYG
jgi:preprotein translocase subunit SecE